MPRHARNPLHVDHPLGWDAFPLGDGLRADAFAQRTGKAAGAVYGVFGLSQGRRRRIDVCLQIAHKRLKAQLSLHCKYIFR